VDVDSAWEQKISKPSISVILRGGGALPVAGKSHSSCNTKGFGRFDVFQSLFILNLFPTLAEHICKYEKSQPS
jgi:hypothetical protein